MLLEIFVGLFWTRNCRKLGKLICEYNRLLATFGMISQKLTLLKKVAIVYNFGSSHQIKNNKAAKKEKALAGYFVYFK